MNTQEEIPNPPAFPTEAKLVEGKSPNRVDKVYIKYPSDWQGQYNMLLPDGITCGDCGHSLRCSMMFDGKDTNTSCQFTPNRFQPKH